jgi:sirohydrochlorin ferrochelatase
MRPCLVLASRAREKNVRVLILVAHGSRRTDANDEVRGVAAALAPRITASYSQVRPAFLELAEPSIPEAIDAAIADGAQVVDVLPYFLAAGRHVERDIPVLVAARQAAHPQVQIAQLDYLGRMPGLVELLVAQLGESSAP